jgi:hypothetical protein
MVEDVLRDGPRIAQLLASELSGRDGGALGAVTVTDADRAAEPTPEGAHAYAIAVEGARVATVGITDRTARIAFEDRPTLDAPPWVADETDLALEADASGEDSPVLVVESGRGVKRAVDVLEELFSRSMPES